MSNPYAPFDPAYLESCMFWLGVLTDLQVKVEVEPDQSNIEWCWDCQDHHDALLLLDLTGCLDAPL